MIAWAAILFVLAAGLRVGWVAARWGPDSRAERLDYPDEEAYVLGARSLAAGDGLIDEFGYRATYMPGYPVFLAVFQGCPRPLLWARIGQAVLAAWVAPATFLLALQFLRRREGMGSGEGRGVGGVRSSTGAGDRCGERPAQRPAATASAVAGGRGVAVLAGVGAACDPFLVFFSGLLLTEALFAAVLVTAWVFVMRGNKRGRSSFLEKSCVPFFLWLAVMLRPAAALLVVVTPVAIVVLGRFRREALIRAVMIPALVMVGLAPWAARNEALIGEWRWLSTRGGISLYDGLQPGASGGSDLAHTKKMDAVQGMTEVEWDHYFSAAAWDAARRDPGRVLRLAGRKFLRTWSLTPNEERHRGGWAGLISAVWMVGVLGLAGLGWWRCRREMAGWMMLLLPVAAFTALHMVYVGSVRYRVPLMPFVMVLSAVGAGEVLRRLGLFGQVFADGRLGGVREGKGHRQAG